jgi:hypothetical protein
VGGAGLGPPTELGAGDVSLLEESGRLMAPSTSSGNSLGNCNALKVHRSGIKINPQEHLCSRQCSGSVTFWYGSGCGSGSSDTYLRLTDPDADPY